MAYTKAELLDAFCRAQNYEQGKLEDETKVQFLQRKQMTWAKTIALGRLIHENSQIAEQTVVTNAEGVEL